MVIAHTTPPYQWPEDPWNKPHTTSTTTTVDSLDELKRTIELAINPPFRGRERKELPHTIIYTDIDGKEMTEESFKKAFTTVYTDRDGKERTEEQFKRALTTKISITVKHTPESSVNIKIQANKSLIGAGTSSVKRLVEGCLSAIS